MPDLKGLLTFIMMCLGTALGGLVATAIVVVGFFFGMPQWTILCVPILVLSGAVVGYFIGSHFERD